MATTQIYCPSCGTPCSPEANFCLRCGKALPKIDVSVSVSQTPDFITLACPNCGGSLKITPDMERFACHYCGLEHMVRRESGVVSLAPVVEGLRRVENKFDHILSGSDRLAAEQTIQRLKNEIPQLEKQIAQKQNYLKKKWGIVTYILILMTGICNFLTFVRNPNLETDGLINLLFFILFGIVGFIGFAFSLGNINKFKIAEDDLLQLKEELQNHKQELDNLHRYAVER